MSTPDLFDSYEAVDDDDALFEQTAYIKACEEAAARQATLAKMTPEERRVQQEEGRCRSLRRMLGRPPTSENDMDTLFNLFSETPDQVNAPIDPMGNTLVHYIANPSRFPAEVNGTWGWREATQRENDALTEWLEVVVLWGRPDPFITNGDGLTAIDLACDVGPAMVSLLCQNDPHSSARTKRLAITRATIMAAAGMAQEAVDHEGLLDLVVKMGADLNANSDLLECNGAMRSCDSFREVLLHLPFPRETRDALDLMLMTKEERDNADIQAVHGSMLGRSLVVVDELQEGSNTERFKQIMAAPLPRGPLGDQDPIPVFA